MVACPLPTPSGGCDFQTRSTTNRDTTGDVGRVPRSWSATSHWRDTTDTSTRTTTRSRGRGQPPERAGPAAPTPAPTPVPRRCPRARPRRLAPTPTPAPTFDPAAGNAGADRGEVLQGDLALAPGDPAVPGRAHARPADVQRGQCAALGARAAKREDHRPLHGPQLPGEPLVARAGARAG